MASLDKDPCESAYKDVKLRKARYCTYKVEQNKTSGSITVTPAKIAERKSNYKEFMKDLSDTVPRFALYDYEYKTKDGRLASTLYFIQWMPENVNQNDRILYSSAKKNLEVILSGVKNVSFEEADEIEELLKGEAVSS